MKTIEQFYGQLKTDESLKKHFAAAGAGIKDEDPRTAFEAILSAIRKAGYDFSYEELEAYAKKRMPGSDGEMSLDELEAVAGGKGFCWGVGGGISSEKDVCACVFCGYGEFGGLGCVGFGL